MVTDRLDAVVVGAGVVGLAVGRELAVRGMEVAVVERNARIGEEISARNSGVIHSGIYYPAGSWKARLCVRGRRLLYELCESRSVAHSRCGKIIVAQPAQEEALRRLESFGRTNGVDDLRWLTGEEVRQLEPAVVCSAGLLSPSTGIVDVHELMSVLESDLESSGGYVVTRTALTGVQQAAGGGFELQLDSGGEQQDLECTRLVNSAGLSAVALLQLLEGYPHPQKWNGWLAKGNYFSCSGARPFRHLIYPMPNEAGLGVHATLDLDGSVRFGPDVEWVEKVDYEVDARRGDSFYAAIREYWPGLKDGALQPGYSGIRPKLVPAGAKAADFVIETPADHGIGGLVNLLGIESPGLTSALAIAEVVGAALAP
jgi:L-2-hydroxyglutarate oxidase LhgO